MSVEARCDGATRQCERHRGGCSNAKAAKGAPNSSRGRL